MSNSNTHDNNDSSNNNSNLQSITLEPIGVVRSVYRFCVGTPRQGLLCPHSRGRVEFTLKSAHDAVDGLLEYSHVWIVFLFHLNTSSSHAGRARSKIMPPANNKKMGVLATRSPHRFNPIGMSLVKLDNIRHVRTVIPGKRPVLTTVLDISGLDLVDGTPVLDIKPYVSTYDAVPLPAEYEMEDAFGSSSDASTTSRNHHVPSWVSNGLTRSKNRSAHVTDSAKDDLLRILTKNPNALEFYGGKRERFEQSFAGVLAAIQQVLSVDVRSQWQTRKQKRKASVKDNNCSTCTQQFDNLLLYYTLPTEEAVDDESESRDERHDQIVVTSIELVRQDHGERLDASASVVDSK
jgi:tRNA-Thr(GGU) m(6)t(6)A37 methyltransferase TsaA